MHIIKGEYGEGNCNVKIKGEIYAIINLEVYYKLKKTRGSHCDFIYIRRRSRRDNEEFEVFAVELKAIGSIDKKKIRNNFQSKFPQTLKFLKNELIPSLGLDSRGRIVKYYAVLVVPVEAIEKISALIRRDKTLLGELRVFDKAGIVICNSEVSGYSLFIK